MLIAPQTDILIVGSNVPEYESGIHIYSEEPTKVFVVDEETQHGDTVWKCLKANTSNIEPGSNSLYWKATRKTNRHKLFDPRRSYATTNPQTIEYTLTVGDVDTVAFLGIDAETIRVVIKDYDGVVRYDHTIEAKNRNVSNWYDWTYVKARQRPAVHFTNLPMIFNATMEITIDNNQADARCTHMAFGTSMDLGITLIDPSPTIGTRNIIPKTKEADGSVKTDNSLTYKRITAYVMVENKRVDDVYEQVDVLNGTPCLFIVDEREKGFASLLAFGFFKDFDIPIGYQKSVYQIEIEGVA
ncbi:MAG: hypothetical protein AB7D96_10720 [Arcobacteraceae bacterium]